MCAGQGCESHLMKYFGKTLKATAFLHLGPHAEKFVTELFSGPLNEKIVEDMMKIFRELETRGNNHKQVPHLTAWHAANHGKLLGAYNRAEVVSTSTASPPASFNTDNLFRYTDPADPTAADLRASGDIQSARLKLHGVARCESFRAIRAQLLQTEFAPLVSTLCIRRRSNFSPRK